MGPAVIIAKAKNGLRADVFVNGKRASRVMAVWALWNGGPGVIEYAPKVANGNLILCDHVDEIATAFRFGWRVELRPLERA